MVPYSLARFLDSLLSFVCNLENKRKFNFKEIISSYIRFRVSSFSFSFLIQLEILIFFLLFFSASFLSYSNFFFFSLSSFSLDISGFSCNKSLPILYPIFLKLYIAVSFLISDDFFFRTSHSALFSLILSLAWLRSWWYTKDSGSL